MKPNGSTLVRLNPYTNPALTIFKGIHSKADDGSDVISTYRRCRSLTALLIPDPI